jgi:hypothetical protein
MLDQSNSKPGLPATDSTSAGAATEISSPIVLAQSDALCGPYDAKYCLLGSFDDESPQERCRRLAHYLKTDGPLVLRAIADHLDRQLDKEGREPVFDPGGDPEDPPLDGDPEGVSATEVVMAALKSENMSATPTFLREMSDLLRGLGEALDANSKWPLRLGGRHRNRGKPVNTHDQIIRQETILEDLRLARKVCGGKLEAAVADVAETRGISRSKIFRAYAMAQRTTKTLPPERER